MNVERYNARAVEIHWQQTWREQNVCASYDGGRPGAGRGTDPPGRIHMGHLRAFTMGDVIARYGQASGAFDAPPVRGGTSPDATDRAAAVTLLSLGLLMDWNSRILDFGLRCGAPAPRRHAAIESLFWDDPDEIIETYGADAVRWFALSDSPPDRDLIWTEPGLRGAWRFVQRLWRVVNNARRFSQKAPAAEPAALSEPARLVRKAACRALTRVSGNIDRRRFHVCVAEIHEFAKALEAVVADSSKPASPDLKFAAREAVVVLVQLFYPMMPHLAEECWAALGHRTLLAARSWPKLDAAAPAEETVTLPVHVNARKRADVTVARDARNSDIEASVLALEAVRRALDGKAPRKVIIVPQRIINVVA